MNIITLKKGIIIINSVINKKIRNLEMMAETSSGFASPYTSLEKGVYLLKTRALCTANCLAFSKVDALFYIIK